jgi:hypothetical protein
MIHEIIQSNLYGLRQDIIYIYVYKYYKRLQNSPHFVANHDFTALNLCIDVEEVSLIPSGARQTQQFTLHA